jgi:hypothetical protein
MYTAADNVGNNWQLNDDLGRQLNVSRGRVLLCKC